MGCAPSTPAAAAAGPPPPGPPPAPPSRDASAMVSLLATTKGLSSPDARKRTGAEAEFRAWTSDWDGFVRREGAERVAAALWAGASLPSAEPASVVLLLLLLAQAELAAVFTLPTAAALLRGAAAMFAAPERHVEVRLAACDVLLAAVKAAPALARPFLLALPAAGGSPPPPVTPGLLASLCASPSSPLELRAACVALAASLCPADGGAGPATEAAVELFAREGLWAAAVALLAAVSSSPAPQPAAAASTHAAPTVALVVQRAVLSALARVCAVGGVASHDALASVPAAIGALTSALASALAQHDPPAPAAAGAGADAGQAPTPLHHHAGAGGHVTTFAAWDGAASVAAVSAALIDALCRRPAAAADRAAVVATGHTTRALLALLSVEWSQPAPGGGPGASDAAGLAHAVATSALEALLAAATASDSPRPSAAQPHHHHEAGGSLPAALGEPRPKAATPALSSRSSRRVVLPPLTAASAAAAPPSASAWAAVLGAAASDGLAALSFVTLLAQASARGGDTYHSLQRLVASHHAPFAAALAPPPPPPPPALLAPEDAGADDPTSALPPRRAAAPAPSSAPPALLTSVEARLVAILTSSAPHMQPARQRCAPLLWQLAVERARHTSARWARLRRLHRLQLAYQVAEAAGRLLAVKAATGVSFAVLEAYAANAASAVADAAAENGSGDIALSGPAAPALPTLPASLLAAAAASELYDWRATGEWVLSVDALGLPTFVHTPSGCAQYLEPSGPPPPQRPPPPPASSSSSSSSAAATAAASSRLEAPDFDSDAEEDHDDHDAGASPPPHSRGGPAAAAAAAQPSPAAAAAATAAAHQYLEGLPREDALALACKIVLVAATAPPVLRSLLGLRLAAQPREDDREGLGVFLGLWRAGYFRHSPAVQAELDAASGIVRRPEESEVDGVAADAAAWWRDDPVVRLCAAGIAAEALTGNAEGRADYRHPLLPPPRSGGGGGGGGGGLAVASDDDLAAGDGEGVEEGETGEGDLIAGEEAEGEQQQPGGGGGGDEGALLRDAEAAVPTALAAGVRELQAGAGPGAIVGTTTRAAPRGRHWPAIALDWDAPWVRDALACIRDVVESLDAARTAAAAATAEAAAAHSSASSASSSSISWPPRGARARAAPSPPPASAAAGAPPPQFQWGPDHLASIARLARSGYAEIAAFAAFAVREAVVPPASVTATTGAGAWAAAAAPAVAPSVTPLALALSPAAAAPEGGDAAAGPVTVAVTYACLAAPLPLPTPAGAAAAAAAAQPAGSGLSCDEARAVLVACGALAGLRAAHGRLSAALPDAYRAAGSTGGGGAAGTATAAGASAASPRRFGASLRALSFGLPSLRRAAGGGAGNGGWMAAYRGGGPPPGGASTAAGAPALLSPSRRQAALLATGGAVHAHVAGAGQDWALGHQLINDALIALAEAGSAAAAAPLAAAVTTTSVVSPLALAAAAAAPSSSSSPTAGHRHHARVTFAAPRPEPADDDATEAPAAVGAPSSSSSSSAPPPGTPTAPAHEAAPAPHDAAEPLSPLEANDALTDFYALKNRILEARSRRSILADKYGDSGSPAAAADGDGSDSAPPA